jgi:hypothetical protein
MDGDRRRRGGQGAGTIARTQVGGRTAFRVLCELPARVYQRQPRLWDRVVLAAGWALLYLIVSGAGPWATPLDRPGAAAGAAGMAFPAEWRLVLTSLVFVLGVWKPVAGYAAFIVAVAYPLYLVSIYVMALSLAVLVMLLPVMAAYSEQGVLFLALLVLLTPLLARVHLAPLIPLLVGLWWEGAGSWIGGGLAALWLKIAAGMAGRPVDLWQLNGLSVNIGSIVERFHEANSLQTVVRLLEPLGLRVGRVPLVRGIELGAEVSYPAPAAMFALYNLLQVLVWAAAGWTVSAVLDRLSAQGMGRRRGWGLAALSLVPGLLLIWAAYVAVPWWLRIDGPGWLEPRWLPAHVVWVGLAAWGLDGLLRSLRWPVAPARGGARAPLSWPRRVVSAETRGEERAVVEEPVDERTLSPSVRPMRRTRRRSERPGGASGRAQAGDQASDIMIELD